ncbi:MAG: hypothetical protein WC238_04545 [Parcubacteria group bacterium]
MKLKKEIIERINGRKDVGHQIAVSMGVTKTTVNNWLRDNKDNNPLTSFTVLQILQAELNLTPDQMLDGEFINQQTN